ncbi:MAG: hypothetical protein ACFFDX_02080 [Candidatus Odinarchaeota archaeon]
MPLQEEHINKFLENDSDMKTRSELIDLLNKRINKLCFEECQVDRILCTLSPLCSRRFLLKLRILSGLNIEDQPKFCYSVHKNIVLRDFRNKTVVYRPFDAYLYLIDFLDVFFHGDYRKLNKFLLKNEFKETKIILDDRINNRDEDFQYLISKEKNYLIFKYEDKIHVIFIANGYVLCNANRESILSLELLKGLIDLFSKIYFPEVKIRLVASEHVEVITIIPKTTLSEVSNTQTENEEDKKGYYLWNVFPNDLDALSQFCREINLYNDKSGNLAIKMCIGVESRNLRYRDLRLIFNIIFRLYNDFYILWV